MGSLHNYHINGNATQYLCMGHRFFTRLELVHQTHLKKLVLINGNFHSIWKCVLYSIVLLTYSVRKKKYHLGIIYQPWITSHILQWITVGIYNDEIKQIINAFQVVE